MSQLYEVIKTLQCLQSIRKRERKNGQCLPHMKRCNCNKRVWLYQTHTYKEFKTEFSLESYTGFDVEMDRYVISILPNEEKDLFNTLSLNVHAGGLIMLSGTNPRRTLFSRDIRLYL